MAFLFSKVCRRCAQTQFRTSICCICGHLARGVGVHSQVLFTAKAYSWISVHAARYKPVIKSLCFGGGLIASSAYVAWCYSSENGRSYQLCQYAKEGNIFEIKRLLHQGADVNEKHPLGWTALHSAAMSGNAGVLKVLLDAGADPNAQDEFSSIYKVASRKHMHVADVVHAREDCFDDRLNKNADFSGFTPLHYAALCDDPECIKLLLDAGADPTIRDSNGHLPESYVLMDSNKQLIKSFSTIVLERKKRQELIERRKYPLEKRFREVIVGQEGAINAVSAAIRRRENGWHDEDHPLVFLFLGSSGIGKTELAKQLALYLHKDRKKAFIRLDMSEYQEKHEVAKMIGAPPGYLGFDQGGQLTRMLRECPNGVVLFDEVDKAHPDVLTVMLQLFDEGRLTDGQGKTVDCKDAIFVMTSNLGSEAIAEHALQLRMAARERTDCRHSGSEEEENSETVALSRKFKDETIYPILKRHFLRDEFLGRITEVVYFLPFSKQELNQLVVRELQYWKTRALKRHGIDISWDADVLDVLADGYDIHYGARSIKHEVERRIINQLAAAHEQEIIGENSRVHIVASYPNADMSDFDGQQRRPTVKLQRLNENKEVVDIVIDSGLDRGDSPILF